MSFEIILIILLIGLIPLIIKEQKQQIQDYKEEQELLRRIENDAILISDIQNSAYYSSKYDVDGIYILSNLNKGNYKYVGQSINMYTRVRNHTKGYGSPDVYNDMRKGDVFTVNFIKLADTNFANLNDLERYYIYKYNTYYKGYNKTRGNK